VIHILEAEPARHSYSTIRIVPEYNMPTSRLAHLVDGKSVVAFPRLPYTLVLLNSALQQWAGIAAYLLDTLLPIVVDTWWVRVDTS
jgi:hypothetical protein